jgi:phenylacetyl-CoA:acceptor oxidoreductase subunit 1
MVHYGMVIDIFQCVACQGCTIACKGENYTAKGVYWTKMLQFESGKYPRVTRDYVHVPCQHCENAPCVDVCPTGASHKRPDGIVLVDYDKCIGCKYCIQACPYGVRHYNERIEPYFPEVGLTPLEQYGYQRHQIGVVEKCTFCAHKIDAGLKAGLKPGVDWDATPACVITCIAKARHFGDLDDPNSEVSKIISSKPAARLKAHLGTRPSVYYVGFKGEL